LNLSYYYLFQTRHVWSTAAARHAIHLQFDIRANAVDNKSETKSKVYSLMYC
jgi:predicted nuclease of restriction endonuclease-like (RecB) superfamily